MTRATAAKAILSATVLVALIAAPVARADPAAPTTPVVPTTAGKVQGEVVDGVYTFKGIPYAADTGGANRWMAPKDPEPWSDIRDATTFMNWCPQADDQAMGTMAAWMGASDMLTFGNSATMPTSENCLGLNVYTPTLDEKLPVMVWIHGGALQFGAGSQYPGEPLVSYSASMDNPVILVTINYRLGFLGYFAHPELSEANFGLLDQVKALEWVRDNIESFGGDPSNVTIFGESAGGASVLALMASPLSEGLFQRVISESGAMEESHNVTVSEGGKLGVAVGEQLGLPAGAGQLEKMREASFEKLVDAQSVMGQDGEDIIMYVAPSLPLPVFTAFEEGKTAQVPLMIGSNADEDTVIAELGPGSSPGSENTTESYEAWVESVYGPEDAKTVLSIFPSEDMSASEIMMNASAQVLTTAWFGAPAIFAANRSSALGNPTYLYYFTQAPNTTMGSVLGAFHGSEMPYIFGDNSYDSGLGLAETMKTYWTNFAATGNPNKGSPGESSLSTGDLPEWKAFEGASPTWQVLSEAEIGTEPVPEDLLEVYTIAETLYPEAYDELYPDSIYPKSLGP